MRQQHLESGGQLSPDLAADAHTTSSNAGRKKNRLILYESTAPATFWPKCPRTPRPGSRPTIGRSSRCPTPSSPGRPRSGTSRTGSTASPAAGATPIRRRCAACSTAATTSPSTCASPGSTGIGSGTPTSSSGPLARPAAGQPADDLHPAAGLAKGPLDEVGVPDPIPVLPGEAQVDGEVVAAVEQAAHRRRIGVAPAAGEAVDPVLDVPDRVRPGLDGVGHLEDRPIVGLDLGLGVLGHFGQDVAGAVDQTPLPQGPGHGALDGADQSGRAVADDQQRAAQPPRPQIGQEPAQASPDSLAAVPSPTNTGWPSVSMPQPASTGSAAALAWWRKWLASRNR